MRSLLVLFVSLMLAGSAHAQSHGGFRGGGGRGHSSGGGSGHGFTGGRSYGGRSFSARSYSGYRGGAFGSRNFSRSAVGRGGYLGRSYRGGYGRGWYGGGYARSYRPYYNGWDFSFGIASLGFGAWFGSPGYSYDPYVYDYPSYYGGYPGYSYGYPAYSYGYPAYSYSYPAYSYDPFYFYGSVYRAPARRAIVRGYAGRPGRFVGDGRWHHFGGR